MTLVRNLSVRVDGKHAHHYPLLAPAVHLDGLVHVIVGSPTAMYLAFTKEEAAAMLAAFTPDPDE